MALVIGIKNKILNKLNMKLENRKKSIITGKDNLEFLYELKSFPAFIGCTSKPKFDDVFADMTWMICKDSGMIQLKNLLPLDLIYSEYHSEALGATWQRHHEQLSLFIKKFQLGNILEVGGSNGTLAKIVTANKTIGNSYTIVEPNPSFNGNENIKVIKAIFDEKISLPNIGTVVHSHVLEHLFDPSVLLQNINDILPLNGIHIFSIPNLFHYLKNKYSNSLNFEHTYFLTEYYTDYLLNKHGFEILDKQKYDDHSIFYATKKSNSVKKPILTNQFEEYKKMYLEMIDFYDSEVNKLNELINNFDGKVYLFGAHIFSQFLLFRGLNYNKIERIIDNSLNKENKRLYGTEMIVANPKTLSMITNAAVILKAGQYQNEVKKQLLDINPNLIIWE